MKTIFTTPKMIAIMLFLFASPFLAMAETYPLYICGGAIANLKPDATVEGALLVGDKVTWQEFTAADVPIGAATVLTVAVVGTAPALQTSAAATVGEHIWKVFVTAVNPTTCSGDVSDPFKFYVLPNKTLALAAPTTSTYCESVASPSSAIVATPTPGAALPQDVTYLYAWTASKNGATAVDGTTIGTATSDATTGTLTVNTTVAGSYEIAASVKYKVPAGSTLKSGDGLDCVQAGSSTRTIVVTPKPGKPSVTFS
ncbi:hypothetical protein ACXZ1K_09465 [Pedobacter sp. PWIIR3]